MRYRGKRLFDLLVAITCLVILSPLLCFAALLVRVFSGSPVIYRREVVGLGEKTFFMFKFRSMVNGAEAQEKEVYNLLGGVKSDNDHRITIVGRFLRTTSVDELPQLLNVIKGQMSLVWLDLDLRRYG